jgi:hypothetical protein
MGTSHILVFILCSSFLFPLTLSPWRSATKALNTAVNAAVQIEPFKLFYSINEGASNYKESASFSPQTTTMNSLPGRSTKPAGMAQMGYACFWPQGGGPKEATSQSDPWMNSLDGEEEYATEVVEDDDEE